jgi:pyruvate dehydrogenase E2 component (dihydrolipoamide acetyltransferase)
MVESARAIPHVCGFHELDAQELVSLRQRLKPLAEARGVRLSFLPFLVKASVAALQAHPYLNASLDEQEQVILLKKSYHIGIATATADGLMVPVIRGADRLGLLDIAREAERLAAAARARTIRPDELQGGTFTITNVGQAGGWFGTSIIRFPEVAILGAGRIEERPVVREGKVVARPILPLSLTFDHRVIDGDGALGFVRSLREKLENPESLLIGEPDFHAA